MATPDPNQQPALAFDPALPHHTTPRLRPVRGFPAQMGDQVVLGLADARQISDRMVFTAPACQLILPLMDGTRGVDDIVAQIGRGLTRPVVETLIAQLDEACLLHGPRFDALWEKVKADFDSLPHLPPGSTAQLADALVAEAVGESVTDDQKLELGPTKLREQMDRWIADALKDAPDPSYDTLPKAIIAPHLDYQRGWINYASTWGRLRVADRPDRVVILGTNHFGQGTGVTACDKGFQTPLGICPVDTELADFLRKSLGEKVFQNRFDHEREHSIELQIGWIQHALGADDAGNFCKVLGVLIHDPAVNNGESYDGSGVALQPFVEAMKAALAKLPGKTLVVASADLSHVGPSFGDQQPLAGEDEAANTARNKVFQHDQDMLRIIASGKPDDLVASMAWQQNPTRWCSTGNIAAAMMITQPADVRILNYSATMDQQGLGMVTSAAAVMF